MTTIFTVIWTGGMAIAIHELGHVVMGKVVGYKLLNVSLFFVFYVQGKLIMDHPIDAISGFTDMSPTNSQINYKDVLMYTMGGPFFSILFSLLGFGMYASTDILLIGYFSFMSLVISLVTLFTYDGREIMDLIKNKNKSDQCKKMLDKYYYTVDIYPYTLHHFIKKGKINYYRDIILLKAVLNNQIKYKDIEFAVEYENIPMRNIISLLQAAISGRVTEKVLNHIQEIDITYGTSLYTMKEIIFKKKEINEKSLLFKRCYENLDELDVDKTLKKNGCTYSRKLRKI